MPDESTPQSAQPLERRLATILCADVAGYSKMMAANEERTVRVFRGHREIFESLVNLHRGRIFNTAGDALLAEFNSAVEAVRCATEIQAALRTRNEHLAPEEKMQFRMGINLGDVIVQGGDLLGDGVNVAARIQTATAPGGICISGSVYDQIQNKLSLDFKLLGEQTYKNIAKPVRTYTINEGAAVTTPARRTGWRALAAITAAVLAIAGAGYWGYQQYDAHRAEQLRVDARLAAQLAAQKQATEQAQHAAEEAKREVQLQAQKLAAEEGQAPARRRSAPESNRIENGSRRKGGPPRPRNGRRQDEGQRRAQEERTQLEQERKRLEAEKQAAEAAKRQAAEEGIAQRAGGAHSTRTGTQTARGGKAGRRGGEKAGGCESARGFHSRERRADACRVTRRHLQRTALQPVSGTRRQSAGRSHWWCATGSSKAAGSAARKRRQRYVEPSPPTARSG